MYEDNKRLYLVQELCTGGELYDHILLRKKTKHLSIDLELLISAMFDAYKDASKEKDSDGILPVIYVLKNTDTFFHDIYEYIINYMERYVNIELAE